MATLRRWYILFLVAVSLLEIGLSALHYILVQQLTGTVLCGAMLYAGVVIAAHRAYQSTRRRWRRQVLLDRLLS